MQNRQAIRKAVKAAIEALPASNGIQVFAQRRVEINESEMRFINVYLQDGSEAKKALGEIEDEAELIIRINSCKALNVDDDLDDKAAPIEAMMQTFTHAAINDVSRNSWRYGDEDETPFSYLELTYNIEFDEQF